MGQSHNEEEKPRDDANLRKVNMLEACGVPEGYTILGLLDETDAGFDTLAMGALRYHLTQVHIPPLAAHAELLSRFEELYARQAPRFLRDENGRILRDENGNLLGAEEAEAFRVKNREDQQRLRHEFVDLLPSLWS